MTIAEYFVDKDRAEARGEPRAVASHFSSNGDLSEKNVLCLSVNGLNLNKFLRWKAATSPRGQSGVAFSLP